MTTPSETLVEKFQQPAHADAATPGDAQGTQTARRILVYTTHKAASMFLHRFLAGLALDLGLRHVSVNNAADGREIRATSWTATFERERARAVCFGPIRVPDPKTSQIFPSDLHEYAVVLHLRDPRDVLTSLFYSHAFSHSTAGGFKPSDSERRRWAEEGVDRYVLARMPLIKERYELLCRRLLPQPNTVLLRYEQLVTDFPAWLDGFLSAIPPSGAHDAAVGLRARLCERHRDDFSVSNEDPYRHKRQIRPGDHLRKLAPRTVATLTEAFKEVLEQLGYDSRL